MSDTPAPFRWHWQQKIAELEGELENARSLAWERAARIAELEAEKQEFANFQLHEVVELRERVAALEAERDEAMNLLGAASASNATLEQAVRELEAERDRLRRVLDVAVADLEEMVAWSTEHGTMRHYAARTLERLSKEFTRL